MKLRDSQLAKTIDAKAKGTKMYTSIATVGVGFLLSKYAAGMTPDASAVLTPALVDLAANGLMLVGGAAVAFFRAIQQPTDNTAVVTPRPK